MSGRCSRNVKRSDISPPRIHHTSSSAARYPATCARRSAVSTIRIDEHPYLTHPAVRKHLSASAIQSSPQRCRQTPISAPETQPRCRFFQHVPYPGPFSAWRRDGRPDDLCTDVVWPDRVAISMFKRLVCRVGGERLPSPLRQARARLRLLTRSSDYPIAYRYKHRV